MTTTTIIERYGGLLKEEPLTCVTNEILLKDTCVLEAVSPYFGYYQTPKSNAPKMLYLLLAEIFPLEMLIRTTNKVQEQLNFPLDAVTGHITMFGQTCNAIRLLNLQNYDQIRKIQELYDEQGVVFKRPERQFQNEMGMIKLRCFYTLHDLGDGIYIQESDPNIGFFEVPRYIPWDEFKKVTAEVKYDTSLIYFDAATAFFYHNKTIVDLVRIYRENLDEEKLQLIRQRYLKVMGSI